MVSQKPRPCVEGVSLSGAMARQKVAYITVFVPAYLYDTETCNSQPMGREQQ